MRRPKGRSHRLLQVGPKITAYIQEHLQIKRHTWGKACAPEDLILPGRGAKTYTTAALCFSFRKAVEAAELPTAYSLRNARHSYSTFLLAKINDLRYVQRQLRLRQSKHDRALTRRGSPHQPTRREQAMNISGLGRSAHGYSLQTRSLSKSDQTDIA